MFLSVIKDRHLDDQYLLTNNIDKAKEFILNHFNSLASANKFREVVSDEYIFWYCHYFENDEGFIIHIEIED